MSKVIIDGVEHNDTRDIRTKVFDDAWRVPIKKSDLPNQAELDAISAKLAQDRWDAEYYNPTTPLLRKEQMRLQREQDQHLDAIDRENAIKAHVESPHIVRRLAEAKALRQQIVSDPERTVSEVIKADRVVQIFALPEADHTIGAILLSELRATENDFKVVKAAVYRKQADEAERKFRETMSGIVDDTKPERIRVEGTDAYSRIEDLADKMIFDKGYSMEDLEVVHKARRAAVLQGDTKLAEAALARFADLSPAIDQSGLEVEQDES